MEQFSKLQTSLKQRNFSNTRSTQSNSTLKGKIPPQAIDLEMAVIGSVLIDSDCLTEVIGIVSASSFYKIEHQEIYKSFLRLYEKSRSIDLLTVKNDLENQQKLEEIGGILYLTELTNGVSSSANVATYARIVTEKFLQRELIRLSTQTVEKAFEDDIDVFELLDTAENNLFQLTNSNITKSGESMDILITKAIKEIESLKDKTDGITGVPSGLLDLDKITSGWQRSDLIIVAARPAMGKTAFTLSIARNAAVDHQKPVAVFSLEMSSVQLVNRLISGETELDASKLRKGNLEAYEWTQLTTRVTRLEEAKMFIDDTPAISIFELRAKCRRLKMMHNIELIVIDYLQLMTAGGVDSKGGNREQEISLISRSLKVIAKELNVPIIALSQLSRAVEARPDKRPQLSDLRESGAIEQDADIVIFLYRAEYYKLNMEDGSSAEGVGEIIIAKHRNGELGSAFVSFIGKYAKFTNRDSNYLGQSNAQFSQMPTVTISSKANESYDDLPF